MRSALRTYSVMDFLRSCSSVDSNYCCFTAALLLLTVMAFLRPCNSVDSVILACMYPSSLRPYMLLA